MSETTATGRNRALRQLLASYAITNGLVFLLSRTVARAYKLDELIGALFLLAGLMSVRADDDDTARYGVRLGGIFPGRKGDDRSLLRAAWEAVPSMLRELGIAIGVAVVVLPIYAACWPMFNRPPAARHFALDGGHVREIATNLLAVALTEELYFRGYIQTRLCDALEIPEPESAVKRVLRAWPAILGASFLFALTHVTVEVTVARAVVFFPGILFGTLRSWRRGIGAAVFLHAISNVFELWLEGH